MLLAIPVVVVAAAAIAAAAAAKTFIFSQRNEKHFNRNFSRLIKLFHFHY